MERHLARSRVFVAFLTLVLLLAPVLPRGGGVAQADEAEAEQARQKAQAGLELVQKCQKAVASLLKRIDPTRVDVAELAKSLGPDAEKCFTYVRDQVGVEPYEGYLRGSRGTLVAGAGNSLDRALLLAELLRLGGKGEVRIVRGTLPEADAGALVDRALARATSRPAPPQADLKAEVAKLAAESGLAEAELTQALESSSRSEEEARKELMGRTDSDLEFLSGKLAEAGVVLGGGAAPTREELVALVSDHYWVQVKEESKWKDLDPSFEDSTPGATRGAAKSQFPPDEVPNKFTHALDVKLTMERAVEGKREEVVLLETSYPSATCVGQRLIFTFVPDAPSQSDLYALPKKSQEERLQFLDSIPRFQPVIMLGSDPRGGRPFDFDGEAFDVPAEGVLGSGDLGSAFGAAAGRVLEAMGRALEGAQEMEKSEKAKKSALLSLNVSWTVRGPGHKPRVAHRTVLDRLSPELRAQGKWELPDKDDPKSARAARLRLVREFAVEVTPGRLGADFVDAEALHLLAKWLTHLEGMFGAVAAGQEIDLEKLLALRASGPPPMHPALFGYETNRQAELERLASESGLYAFYASPSVAIYSVGHEVGAEGVPTEVFVAYDIIANPVRFLKAGDKAGPPHEVALRQGVVDTNLERLLAPSPKENLNASNVFAAARAAGAEFEVLSPGAASRVEGLEVSASVRERIGAELAAGRAVVVPRKPVSMGNRQVTAWWVVDPAQAQVLGVLEDGTGSATTEYLINVGKTFAIIFAICLFVGAYAIGKVKWGHVAGCALAAGAAAFGMTPTAGLAGGLLKMSKILTLILAGSAIPFGFGAYPEGSWMDQPVFR